MLGNDTALSSVKLTLHIQNEPVNEPVNEPINEPINEPVVFDIDTDRLEL